MDTAKLYKRLIEPKNQVITEIIAHIYQKSLKIVNNRIIKWKIKVLKNQNRPKICLK